MFCPRQHRERGAGPKKNDINPWIVKTWGVPPAGDASWRNMAETESSIMNSQCLNRRLDSQSLLAEEVASWEQKRNLAQARIHWTFTLAAARRKLRKRYPSIED